MQQVGLLGGTFDPVHVGHLELGRLALQKCQLTKVVFIPSASPPHKLRCCITAFHHRVAMLRLAVAEESRFQVSEIEAQLRPPSYTIDTLTLLLGKETTQTEYYFIIGSDAFFDIQLWHEYRQVLAKVHVIIAARQGILQSELQDFIRSLGYKGQGDHWHNIHNGRKIILLNREVAPASSSAIRKDIRHDASISQDVPLTVQQYIRKHKLYSREKSNR